MTTENGVSLMDTEFNIDDKRALGDDLYSTDITSNHGDFSHEAGADVNGEDEGEDDDEVPSGASLEDGDFEDLWDLFGAMSTGLETAPRGIGITEQQREDERASDHIDVDDFEGFDQFLFTTLKQNIRDACNVNTGWAVRKKAAEWIFVSKKENASGVSFADTCRALGARRTVIQARVQHQLYRAGVPFPEPLSFFCDALCETLSSEILLQHGSDAMKVAKMLWTWPGIRADIFVREVMDLIPELTHDRIDFVLKDMEKYGYVALKHGFWFFISRNPDTYSLMGRSRFQWSKAFVGSFE